MIVREAMITKPITVKPDDLVIEAAKLMRDKKIGSVIIVEKEKVIGIATERDLVRRVIAENKNSKLVKISEIMSTPVVSVSQNEDVKVAAYLMKRNGIRRLVVMEHDKLVGVITTDDLARNMVQVGEDIALTLIRAEQRAMERHGNHG